MLRITDVPNLHSYVEQERSDSQRLVYWIVIERLQPRNPSALQKLKNDA